MFLNATHTGQTSLVHGQPSTSKPYQAYTLFPDVTPGYASGTETAWQERKVIKKDLLEARLKKEEEEKAKKVADGSEENVVKGLKKRESQDEITLNSVVSDGSTICGGDQPLENDTTVEWLIQKAKKGISKLKNGEKRK
ncbi:hypothetical protein QCA50_016066 [Cerrena zonata]